MQDEIFARRLKNWKSEGELTAFNLACVAEALDTVKRLSDQNIGGETVEKDSASTKAGTPTSSKLTRTLRTAIGSASKS